MNCWRRRGAACAGSPPAGPAGDARGRGPDRHPLGPPDRPGRDDRRGAGHARNVLEWRLDPASDHRHPQAPRLTDHVILLCDEGYQSSLAAATLQQLGFTRATDVDGGFRAWRQAGLPVLPPGALPRPVTAGAAGPG
ncbi:MAG TPA: rhodanese-like domain-containing protein [Streptosporangiaceae bacterium]